MIGSDLKRLREQVGRTQTELAEMIGLKQAHVSAVEVGRRVTTTDVMERWVDACEGKIQILGPADIGAPSGLTPQQKSLLKETEGMPEQDIARAIQMMQLMKGPATPIESPDAPPAPVRPRAREENPVVMPTPTKQRERRLQ